MKQNVTGKVGSAYYGRMRTAPCPGESSGLPTVLSMESSDSMMVSSDPGGDLSPNCTEKALLKSSSKEVSDCLSEWITYLQMLNGLCGAGSRLAQSLSVLQTASNDANSGCAMRATQCQTLWEDLAQVVASATSVVRTQAVRALQDIEQHADPTQACRSLTTLLGLQYQFCVACCECLGAMAPCHCCSAAESATPRAHDSDCMVTVLQHNFARLYLPPPPAVRSPMPFPLPMQQSLQQSPQRRWSEAAAREMAVCGESMEDGMMRRWSMPWDVRGANSAEQQAPWSGRLGRDKLCVPGAVLDRSRSTTPESTWHSSLASQEELADVISLLSCRPNTATYPVPLQLCHPSHHHPGVTVSAADDSQMKTCTHSMQGWCEPSAETTGEAQASQKSSSSTDSSSLSLHSRSSGGDVPMDGRPQSQPQPHPQPHLYSMWSGADVPFIKLPEAGDVNSERFPQ